MKLLLLIIIFLSSSVFYAESATAARFTPANLCVAIDESDYESITLPITIGGDYATGSVQSITTIVGDTEAPGGNQAATGDNENVVILLDTNNDGIPEVLSNDQCNYDASASPPGCSVTQNITIPNVTEDTTFRGRVMLSFNNLTPLDSCGDNSFGDSEDYLLVANVNETITITDVSAPEDNGAITVTATLSHNVQDASGFAGFSVDYATSDGTATVADNDYIATSGTLNFNGQAGETVTFTITPNADIVPEGDQTILVSLTGISNSTHGIDISDTATITLVEDDTAVDLTLAKMVSDLSPDVGDTIVFTLEVSNAGPDAAVAANVVDTVPGGFTAVTPLSSPSGSTFAVTGNTISWTGIDVPVGGVAVATFSAEVAAP